LAPTTASSIRKTFTSRLDLWLNPILDEATATNDFDLRELRMRPMSVYVGVNPDDLERLKPLLNLFFEQAIGLQTRELPEHHPKLKLQVLMLLDEFASMGRIPVIANAVAFLPGYNVRVLIVIQTPSQLRDVYGHDAADTIQKALATRIVYAPKDFSDAEEISKELGNTTVKARSLSKPSIGFDSKGKRQRSVNVSEQRRALLLPQEVQQIGRERQIVFYEGLRPMLCYKSRYYRERFFRRRLLPPPERGVAPPTATPTKGKPEAPGAVAATPEIIDDSFSKAAKPTRIRRGKRRAGKRVDEPTGKDPGKHRTREATVADIERIETLTLDDFDADFSQVAIPDTDRLSERDLQVAAASFLSALREK
jgi:type IV secretion system protein VirD4